MKILQRTMEAYSFCCYCRPFQNLNSVHLLLVFGIVFVVLISDSSCEVLQILDEVLFYNMIAIGKLLDPKFLIKARKIKFVKRWRRL